MPSPELEARLRASTVVCQMMLICFRLMIQGYNRDGKNLAAIFPEILTIIVIRVCEGHHRSPVSINRLAKLTGLPRRTVGRALVQLMKHGVVVKSGDGYATNEAYVQARINAVYFKRMVAAIKAACHELRDFT